MLVPYKWTGDEHLCPVFHYPVYLRYYLFEVKNVLKHFTAENRIKMPVTEGNGFAIIHYINTLVPVRMPFVFKVKANVFRDIYKKIFVRFTATTKIKQFSF